MYFLSENREKTRKFDDTKASFYKASGGCYFVPFHFSSAVVCPKLTVPDNVGVVPSSCSQTDVEYGTRCVFYCNDGYELSGPRYTGCQNDTSWTEIAPLSCVRGQFSRVRCLLLRRNFGTNTIALTRKPQNLIPLLKLIWLRCLFENGSGYVL